MDRADEIATAARVVILLLNKGLLANTRPTLTHACQHLGIAEADIHKAKDWALDHNFPRLINPPSGHPSTDFEGLGSETPAAAKSGSPPSTIRRSGQGPQPPADRAVTARPPGMKPARSNRPTRLDDFGAVAELYCTGAEGHPAHWAPVDQFMRRADRPWLHHTHCDIGRRAYQKANRVTVQVREDLEAIGVRITVDDGSNLLNVICKTCQEPFAPGDEIHGQAEMSHVTCPSRSDDQPKPSTSSTGTSPTPNESTEPLIG